MDLEMRRFFWSWFEGAADDLRSRMLSGQIGRVLSELECRLRDGGFDFGLDLMLERDIATLVVTPEGDAASAAMIDRFVAGRAAIPGWRILDRRPKRSIGDARLLAWRLHGVDVADAIFGLDRIEEGFTVTMVADAPPDRVLPALAAFLDHALGEQASMDRVKRLVAVGPRSRPAVPLSATRVIALLLDGQRSDQVRREPAQRLGRRAPLDLLAEADGAF